MASKAWQNKERLVAVWFKSHRNPLSGRNNRSDDGSMRLGDVIHPTAMIEVKRRKALGMKEALETRKLAKENGVPWVHIEFQTGLPDMVKLTVPYDVAEFLCSKLNELWTKEVQRGV